jgi:ubiquinone/menaquinone biosynthesis C-methylase UbiE
MLFDNIVNDLTKIVNKINRMRFIEKAILILSLMLLISVLHNNILSRKEGFEEKKEYILKEGPAIYDNFYANIYDSLVFNKLKNEYEVGEIINSTKPTTNSILLDIGCGTGHHLDLFKGSFSDMIGLDISPDMVQTAKNNYPDYKYQLGNALNNMTYESNSFTHITCLYFTIYYMQDKKQFFENAYNWLMPGGYLVIHLVDRDHFDPIIPAGDPTIFISPQKYAKERITESVVVFDNYEYKANFDILSDNIEKNRENRNEDNSPSAVLKEVIRNIKSGGVRQNNHNMYMSTQKHILSQARSIGFIMLKQLDMKDCKYDHQYLYVLQKPN